jgi:hypothetical protein
MRIAGLTRVRLRCPRRPPEGSSCQPSQRSAGLVGFGVGSEFGVRPAGEASRSLRHNKELLQRGLALVVSFGTLLEA